MDFNDRYGRTCIKTPPPVLFNGTHPLVNSATRERLLRLELPNIALQPAIFIDDWGTWHEDYWFVTFLSRLDCWDRHASKYEQDVPSSVIGGFELHQVYRFSLSDEALEGTPLNQRQLFQLGGSVDAFSVAHQSVAAIFSAAGGGVHVLPIQDYPSKY